MGIEDSPGRAAVDTSMDDQLAISTVVGPKEVSSQGLSSNGGNNSSYKDGSAQIEEELNLISAGMLPPRYKELVSASAHLAPPRFHESIRRCP